MKWSVYKVFPFNILLLQEYRIRIGLELETFSSYMVEFDRLPRASVNHQVCSRDFSNGRDSALTECVHGK